MDTEAGVDQAASAESNKSQRPLDITVLMGGPSTEREVSLISGANIADALHRAGHNVSRADISPDDTSALDRDGIDVVFIALHGQFGESGEVQALCEARGLPYTGSGPRPSALAMDKDASKQIFRQAGLTTPDWTVVERGQPGRLEQFPPPVVLKPVNGGSSIDITIARDEAARDGALESLVAKYGRAMIERFVAGRELTVGILGTTALPVLEVVSARPFYDYLAKYADDSGTRYVFDHGLDAATAAAAKAAALITHRSLGCRDLSRVDFLLDAEGNLNVLEINTIPGFTKHSLVPMAAAEAGIGMEQLVDRLANMAVKR